MADAAAQKLFQPPGANLTYGDVTHGMRVQSASTNPAAAAADMARQGDEAKSGAVVSAAAGVEFGNIQQLWDFYDDISRAYQPSDGDVIVDAGAHVGLFSMAMARAWRETSATSSGASE